MKQTESYGSLWLFVLCAWIGPGPMQAAPSMAQWKFDFGPGPVAPGYTAVLPHMIFTSERGFGFAGAEAAEAVRRQGDDPLRADFVASTRPFFFSVVEGIKANHLGLARFLADDVSPFDPGRPDPPSLFALPPSPSWSELTPEGN